MNYHFNDIKTHLYIKLKGTPSDKIQGVFWFGLPVILLRRLPGKLWI